MSKITISNEDAIKRIKEFALYHAIKDLPNSILTVEAFRMAIKALESKPIAYWKFLANSIRSGETCWSCNYVCSNCNYSKRLKQGIHPPNFCEQCGAKMVMENING